MSEASVPPFVYLENAQAPLAFGEPIEVVTAHQISDVPAAFAQMQEAQNAGDWLAGYASYELGYALEEKLAGLMPKERDIPLLCFGRFKAPDVLLARSLMHQARMTQAKATLSSFQPTRSREAYASAFETVKAWL